MHHSGVPRHDQTMIAYKILTEYIWQFLLKKHHCGGNALFDLHDQNKPELSYHKTDIKQVAIPTYNHVVTRANIILV